LQNRTTVYHEDTKSAKDTKNGLYKTIFVIFVLIVAS